LRDAPPFKLLTVLTSPRPGTVTTAGRRGNFYSFNYTTVFVISHFRLAVELAELIR
jgi:hypothetical protein